MNFCADGEGILGIDNLLQKYIADLYLSGMSPMLIFQSVSRIFYDWIQEKKDPWKNSISVPDLPTTKTNSLIPTGKRYLNLPVFKEGSRHKRESDIDGIMNIELDEGKIFNLVGSNVGIVVGGSSGSGKSTLAASLTIEMQNIIRSLSSRFGDWEDLSLCVECVSVDLATLTTPSILEGVGQDKEKLIALKKPWTVDLALEALEIFNRSKQMANITIADLPGGKIDSITQITSAQADVAIMIAKDWNDMPQWITHFRLMGTSIVGRLKSALPDDGLPSVVTLYNPRQCISGRVVGLNRMVRSWDRSISWLAEFLLFDILPSYIEMRRQRIGDILKFKPHQR